MTYPEVDDLQLRTDFSFRNQLNEEHHHGQSILSELPVDMVKSFPIGYMHQVCLGCMKRLLLIWMRSMRQYRESADHTHQISSRLEEMKKCIPSAFARKPGSLKDIDRWKATEYRQFLLYTGMMALKGILRSDFYEHFLH